MVAAAAAGGAWWAGLIGSDGAAANSIAVLPFDNLSGDPDRNYFSDGLAPGIKTGRIQWFDSFDNKSRVR